jgi:hypothetical protein
MAVSTAAVIAPPVPIWNVGVVEVDPVNDGAFFGNLSFAASFISSLNKQVSIEKDGY